MNLTSRDKALHFAFWSVLASEAVLFAGLIAVRAGGPMAAPPPQATVLAGGVVLALFIAAGTLATAARRLSDGLARAASRLIAVAVVSGFAALVLEISSARVLGAHDPTSLVLRGLHLAYVSAAIGLSTWSLVLVRCSRPQRRESHVLSLVTSYWYFVGIVWLAAWPMFATPCP
jgi:heme/copper-type cytochrome/quinol oxidase subunit 3